MKTKLFTLLVLIACGFLLLTDNNFKVRAFELCSQCDENYYTCRIAPVDTGTCVEGKMRECRNMGYPQADCENYMDYYQQQCSNELETEKLNRCSLDYNYCYATCTPGSDPPPPGSNPGGPGGNPPNPPSNCYPPTFQVYRTVQGFRVDLTN